MSRRICRSTAGGAHVSECVYKHRAAGRPLRARYQGLHAMGADAVRRGLPIAVQRRHGRVHGGLQAQVLLVLLHLLLCGYRCVDCG